MPRTFSLARLLLAITIFCLLCGLAVNFPLETGMSLPPLAAFGLPLGACLLMCRVSRYPIPLGMVCYAGVAIGLLLLPVAFDFVLETILGFPSSPGPEGAGLLLYRLLPVGGTLGCLTAGLGFLTIELYLRHRTRQNPFRTA